MCIRARVATHIRGCRSGNFFSNYQQRGFFHALRLRFTRNGTGGVWCRYDDCEHRRSESKYLKSEGFPGPSQDFNFFSKLHNQFNFLNRSFLQY